MIEVIESNGDDFDSLVAPATSMLVVVDFWGPGCPNCEVYAAAEPGLLARLGDAPLRIVKVNAYEHEGIARRYAIVGIPCFVLIRDGRVLGMMRQFHGPAYWLAVVREHLPSTA